MATDDTQPFITKSHRKNKGKYRNIFYLIILIIFITGIALFITWKKPAPSPSVSPSAPVESTFNKSSEKISVISTENEEKDEHWSKQILTAGDGKHFPKKGNTVIVHCKDLQFLHLLTFMN